MAHERRGAAPGIAGFWQTDFEITVVAVCANEASGGLKFVVE